MLSLLYAHSVQGSAIFRIWNCVSRLANVVLNKFSHLTDPIMPRPRRRHHSRSRTRSRSHSHDRERDAKRRKIESYDSPHHRRSVSSEPDVTTDTTAETPKSEKSNVVCEKSNVELIELSDDDSEMVTADEGSVAEDVGDSVNQIPVSSNDETDVDAGGDSHSQTDTGDGRGETDEEGDSGTSKIETDAKTPNKPKANRDVSKTPNRHLTPKQKEKRLESEKKKLERQKEREERERKRQEEKEQRQKEKEEKLKEKEREKEKMFKEKEGKKKEKELKRKEREEKEEQKRKEREQEKLKKQQEIDEKNREKQRLEEQKQRAAAAFTKFFKKVEEKREEERKSLEKRSQAFMPFEKKADMELAPISRYTLSGQRRTNLEETLNYESKLQTKLYLDELRGGKEIGKSGKTCPLREEEDDVIVIGETIEEENKVEKKKAKFLLFTENQRPPYFGTFRKKSKTIRAKNPFGRDDDLFNYEVDSEEEWEDEGEGESLKGSDDEVDKENNEEDDYEVDNEFFVPHGHLSDDEVDDEVDRKLSPESFKAKLKLLKNEFDEEMKSKQKKLKPSVIGCVFHSRTKPKSDFERYLIPLSVISNGPIEIKKRSEAAINNVVGRKLKQLTDEHIPVFLKFIHGSTKKSKEVVSLFLEHLKEKEIEVEVSRIALYKQLKQFADSIKRQWVVKDEYQKKFNIDLPSLKILKKDASTLSPEK